MKYIVMLFITCVSFIFFSGVYAQMKTLKKEAPQASNSKKQKPREGNYEKLLKRVLSSNEKIKKLLETKTKEPLIWEGDSKVLSGKVFSGTLLNAVVSTNLTSPLVVVVDDHQGKFSKSKFLCQGTTIHERVHTLCHKLITQNREISVSAQLLSSDGSAGLMGYVEDDKAPLIAGAVLSDFSQGVLSSATLRIATPLGEVRDGSIKNQMLGGLIESGKTTSDILTDELKRAEPIISIPSGTKVLIYFMEAINENI